MNPPIALPDLTTNGQQNGSTLHWPTDLGGAHTKPRVRAKYAVCRPGEGDEPGLETTHYTMADLVETAILAHAGLDDGTILVLVGPGLPELAGLASKFDRIMRACPGYGVTWDEDIPSWVRLLTSPDVEAVSA